MSQFSPVRRLTMLLTDSPFPSAELAWGVNDPIPGLLCAGADLSVQRLVDAYSQGIFPWYSEGEPILWWSPDPRMVLEIDHFKLHRSLRKTIKAIKGFNGTNHVEIKVDSAFPKVINHCANAPRKSQSGTWIVPAMQAAYIQLHEAGFAHSIETWIDNELVGGLYCTVVGNAVFGESMFAHQTDASKIALTALVAFCKSNGITWIDCQQQTKHLASLGAAPVPRSVFQNKVAKATMAMPLKADERPVLWQWSPDLWDAIL